MLFLYAKTAFLSTPSVGRATKRYADAETCSDDFYPRPPWGGRRAEDYGAKPRIDFYPRPPWGGRRRPPGRRADSYRISIHALRGEGDILDEAIKKAIVISIHALRGEGDFTMLQTDKTYTVFLSTPSVGRATKTHTTQKE